MNPRPVPSLHPRGPDHGQRHDPDLGWLDRRLAELGFGLVLCSRREETFERARQERLKVSGKPGQYDDLRPFIAEQALLRRLARTSAMPLLGEG